MFYDGKMKHREDEVIPDSEAVNVGIRVYPPLSDSSHSLLSSPQNGMLSIQDGAPDCSAEMSEENITTCIHIFSPKKTLGGDFCIYIKQTLP